MDGKQCTGVDAGDTGDDGSVGDGAGGVTDSGSDVTGFGDVGLVTGGVGGISPVMLDRACTTWMSIVNAPIGEIDVMSQSALCSISGSSDRGCTLLSTS